jgi:chemotaxis protein histidine kinase CheA/CheY-like chemotaxis protein
MTPPVACLDVAPLAGRLSTLCGWLDADESSPPGDLAAARADLEQLRTEAEGSGLAALAEALRRLAALIEVWECLAVDAPESAREVAAFCARALGHLAGAGACAEGPDDSAWILRESTERWGDYLGLLDPWSTPALAAAGGDQWIGGDAGPEDAVPAIDPGTLLRLLGGRPEPGPFPRDAGTSPTQPAGERAAALDRTDRSPNPSGPGSHPAPPLALALALDLDPELRGEFLAEATGLFERIEGLVLDLGRTPGRTETLTELRRCFHTLKGAAGSVGLSDLAARIHELEERLEPAGGRASDELIDALHQSLGAIDAALDGLRRGPRTTPFPPSAEAPAPPHPDPRQGNAGLPRSGATGSTANPCREPVGQPHGFADEPVAPRAGAKRGWDPDPPAPRDEPLPPPAPSTQADGPIRVPAERIEELMDLASELIAQRGQWNTQAESLKQLAAQVRACRFRMSASLDGLQDIGLARGAPAGFDPRADLPGLVRQLVEQADDLAMLAESALAAAIPLTLSGDALARLTLGFWEAMQAIQVVPIHGLFQRLARVALDAARVEGRQVELATVGEETGIDRAVQDQAFEPLLHLVRNAVGHGIEPAADRVAAGKPAAGRVTVSARREGSTLVVTVEDDGRGLDYAAIEAKGRRLGLIGPGEPPSRDRLSALIFHAGFTTRPAANAISGRGVGLDVVAQEVARLHGTIELDSQPGRGTRLTLRLPARLALEQAMVVRVAGQAFALPIASIELAQAFAPGEREGSESSATVLVRDRRVPLIDARAVLGFSTCAPASCPKLLLVRAEGDALALLVDAIEGARELVIKPLDTLLAGHPVLAGTSFSITGEVILALNPLGLNRWRLRRGDPAAPAPASARRADDPHRPAPVLVVDDSISVRRVAARHLRALGVEIDEVSDGLEALTQLRSRRYGLVLTDLEMPRMDGFELLAELRRSAALAAIPVVVASTRRDPETRRRALDLGARAVLAKPVEPDELARTIGRWLPVMSQS